MRLDKYKPNRRGLKDLLGHPGIFGDLLERGFAVAAAAKAQYEAHPPHEGKVEVVVAGQLGVGTRIRDRVAVIAKHPGALPIERDRRPLGKAMDAARHP